MKKFLICFLLPLYISGEIQVISQDIQAGISSVKTNSKFIPLYEKFELTFQAQGNWDNPFDPEQVAIDCEVYTPGGILSVFRHFIFRIIIGCKLQRVSTLNLMEKPAGKYALHLLPRARTVINLK